MGFESWTHCSDNICLTRKSGGSYIKIDYTIYKSVRCLRKSCIFCRFSCKVELQAISGSIIGDISISIIECRSGIIEVSFTSLHAIIFFNESKTHRNIRKEHYCISLYRLDPRNLSLNVKIFFCNIPWCKKNLCIGDSACNMYKWSTERS